MNPTVWTDLPVMLCSLARGAFRSCPLRSFCLVRFRFHGNRLPPWGVSRFRRRRALELMVNLQVCCLNFVFLGFPFKCPGQGCRGELSDTQRNMVQCLWDRNCSNCRLVDDLSSGFWSKLLGVQSESIAFDTAFESLRDLVYEAAKQRASSSTRGSSTEVVLLKAHKVAFPSTLKGFDATPFLLGHPQYDAFSHPSTFCKPG